MPDERSGAGARDSSHRRPSTADEASPGPPPDLLPDYLTDAQRDAITHEGGPLLVVAGPGAGKTAVMVRRAAYLVAERGADPRSLLVTTFTNKAAEELYDRLYPFLGPKADEIHISTLHSSRRTSSPKAASNSAGVVSVSSSVSWRTAACRVGQ